MHGRVGKRVDDGRWTYLINEIVTAGAAQPWLKLGVAIAVLRDGLAAPAARHRDGIIHGDVKPSNIMLKRTGDAKLADVGSAFARDTPAPAWTCTPAYAPKRSATWAHCRQKRTPPSSSFGKSHLLRRRVATPHSRRAPPRA